MGSPKVLAGCLSVADESRNMPVYQCAWCLPTNDPLESCRMAAEAGFDGISFVVHPRRDFKHLDDLSRAAPGELREAISRLGLGRSLHVLTPAFIIVAGDDSGAARLAKEQIQAWAEALSDPALPPLTITLDPPEVEVFRVRCLLTNLLDDLVGFLKGLGERHEIVAGLENWPWPPADTPEAMTRLLARYDGAVGVLLDVGHANVTLRKEWCHQESMAEFVAALPAPVVEVHFHDNHGEADEHLMPGEGTADLMGALDALRAAGFAGPVSIECDLAAEGRPGLAEGLKTIRARYDL